MKQNYKIRTTQIKNKQIIKLSYGIRGKLGSYDPFTHWKIQLFIRQMLFTRKRFYIWETKRNSEVRRNEHCSPKKSSEVGDNPLVNPDHNCPP